MLNHQQDLAKVLETELRFLDNGGYRNPDMWRPQFIFLDSPTCMHPAGSGRPEACTDCPLIGFVPRARRSAPVPCHHIPLTREGFTVDSLSRWGTQEELENALRDWLLEKLEAITGIDRSEHEQNALRGWLLEKLEAITGSDRSEHEQSPEIEAVCNRMAG
jgi:hypothetical protein